MSQAAASFRCAASFFTIIQSTFNFDWTPVHTTIEQWMLRLSCYKWTRPLQEEGWTLLVDFAVKVGSRKCLIILGVKGQTTHTLSYKHVEPIYIELMEKSNKEKIKQALLIAKKRIGIPKQIISDSGSDIKGGIQTFIEDHSETIFTYDIVHKLSCLVKSELYQNKKWQDFTEKVSETKQKTKQTVTSFLAPLHQRKKARWINVDVTIDWAKKIKALSKNFKPIYGVNSTLFKEKLGWIDQYNKQIEEYDQITKLTQIARNQVREKGLYQNSEKEFVLAIKDMDLKPKAKRISNGIRKYLKEEGEKAKDGERLLASTEILESFIGKYKYHATGSALKDFTTMTLSMASCLGQITSDFIKEAFEAFSWQEVQEWCKSIIGQSDYSKRKKTFS